MMPDLDSRLAEAKQRAASLHARTDELNVKLAAFEERLVALDLGVTASTKLPDCSVVFGKHDGVRGLFVTSVVMSKPIPLRSASRDTRCSFALVAEDLIDALLKELEVQHQSIGNALVSIENATGRLT